MRRFVIFFIIAAVTLAIFSVVSILNYFNAATQYLFFTFSG